MCPGCRPLVTSKTHGKLVRDNLQSGAVADDGQATGNSLHALLLGHKHRNKVCVLAEVTHKMVATHLLGTQRAGPVGMLKFSGSG